LPSCIHKFAQRAHRRQVGEAVGAKALHAPAFVVDADQQVGAQVLDLGAQGTELRAAFPVASKQDDPAGERVPEALAVRSGQPGAGNIEDDGGSVHHEGSGITRDK
jgi:hypothetical protein